MTKLLFVFLLTLTLTNASEMGLKGGGCTLVQEGDVKVHFNNKIFNDVKYSSESKSGKNFREILVGSIIDAGKDLSLKIIDYVPNKRIKGKPKTGVFIVETTIDSVKKNSTMSYIFDSGIISATGIINKTTIGFWTKIKYTVCSVDK